MTLKEIKSKLKENKSIYFRINVSPGQITFPLRVINAKTKNNILFVKIMKNNGDTNWININKGNLYQQP